MSIRGLKSRPILARIEAITYEKQVELLKRNIEMEYINISRSFKLGAV